MKGTHYSAVVFLWRSSTSICNRCDKPSVSQGPQATFGVRCTQLAPKHGGPQTAQIESYPPFPPFLAPKLPVTPALLRTSHPKKRKKGQRKGIRLVGWGWLELFVKRG